MSGSPLAAAVWLHAVVARVISLMRMLVVVKAGKLIVLWDCTVAVAKGETKNK